MELTVTEAAEKAGVSVSSIRNWIASGELKAKKKKQEGRGGYQWIIDSRVLKPFITESTVVRSKAPKASTNSSDPLIEFVNELSQWGPVLGEAISIHDEKIREEVTGDLVNKLLGKTKL